MDINAYSIIYGYEDLYRKAVTAGKPELQEKRRRQLLEYIANSDFSQEKRALLMTREKLKLQIIEDEYNLKVKSNLLAWQKKHWLMDLSEAYQALLITYNKENYLEFRQKTAFETQAARYLLAAYLLTPGEAEVKSILSLADTFKMLSERYDYMGLADENEARFCLQDSIECVKLAIACTPRWEMKAELFLALAQDYFALATLLRDGANANAKISEKAYLSAYNYQQLAVKYGGINLSNAEEFTLEDMKEFANSARDKRPFTDLMHAVSKNIDVKRLLTAMINFNLQANLARKNTSYYNMSKFNQLALAQDLQQLRDEHLQKLAENLQGEELAGLVQTLIVLAHEPESIGLEFDTHPIKDQFCDFAMKITSLLDSMIRTVNHVLRTRGISVMNSFVPLDEKTLSNAGKRYATVIQQVVAELKQHSLQILPQDTCYRTGFNELIRSFNCWFSPSRFWHALLHMRSVTLSHCATSDELLQKHQQDLIELLPYLDTMVLERLYMNFSKMDYDNLIVKLANKILAARSEFTRQHALDLCQMADLVRIAVQLELQARDKVVTTDEKSLVVLFQEHCKRAMQSTSKPAYLSDDAFSDDVTTAWV